MSSEKNVKSINVFISLLSPANSRYKKDKYKYISDKVYLHDGGIITNYPMVQLIRQELSDVSHGLDYYIVIASDETRKPTELLDNNNVPDWLSDRLNDTDDPVHGKSPVMRVIEITDDPNDRDTISVINDIKSKLDNLKAGDDNESEINVYIDSQGGIRHVIFSVIMSAYVWDRDKNSGIKLRKILSSNSGGKKNKNEPFVIWDYKDRYDAVKMFSAVDEFINYGKTTSLRSYMIPFVSVLENSTIDKSREISADMKNCLHTMTKFADDLQLCRSGYIKEDIIQFYNDLEEFIRKYSNEESYGVQSFVIALRTILNEFSSTMTVENGIQRTNELDVIKWCIDKDFVQQALTLVSENLLDYLFEDGEIYARGGDINRKIINNSNDHGNYSEAYTLINRMNIPANKYYANKHYKVFYERLDTESERKSVESRWLEFCMTNSKGKNQKLFEIIQKNKLIDRINTLAGMNMLCDVVQSFPIKSKSMADKIARRYGINEMLIAKKWRIGGKKGKKKELNYYELLKLINENESFIKSQFSDGLINLINAITAAEKAENIIRKIIDKYNLSTDVIDKEDQKKLEMSLAYIFYLYDCNVKELPDQYKDNKLQDWFANTYLGELFDILEVKEKSEIRRVKKYLYETFFIKTPYRAMFESNVIKSESAYKCKILYWYRLLKNQRNLSNHAVNVENETGLVMTSEQMKRSILTLINMIELE